MNRGMRLVLVFTALLSAAKGGYPEGEVIAANTIQYDAVGNRKDLGASASPGNRLTAFDGYSFTYDYEGRTVSKTASGFS